MRVSITAIDRTCNGNTEVWLVFLSFCLSDGLAKHCLTREAFLRHKSERRPVLYISNVGSHLSQSLQSRAQVIGWLVGRYTDYDSATVQCLEIIAHLSGDTLPRKGVERAQHLHRARERINDDDGDAAEISICSEPR